MPRRLSDRRASLGLWLVRGLGCIALSGLGAGCGGSTDAVAQFTGAWHYDSATGVVTCASGDTIDEPPMGDKTFGAGVSVPLVDLSVSPLDSAIYCNFAFDVMGPYATAQAGQICALTGGDELSVDAWTFTLVNGPTTAQEKANATIHITTPGTNVGDPPILTTCSYVLSARLTKVSKD
jgi:hypothetical protein